MNNPHGVPRIAALAAALAAATWLCAQNLQITGGLSYQNGADQYNQPTQLYNIPVANPGRSSLTQYAQPATNHVAIGDGQHAGFIQVRNLASAGTIYFGFDGTNFPIVANAGEPGGPIRVATNTVNLYEYASASNTAFTVNAFPN